MENSAFYDTLLEKLAPFIVRTVKEELAGYFKAFEADLDRKDSGSWVRCQDACKALGVSRQTLYNWEKGLYNIGNFVKRQGRYKLYDVNSIKAKLAGIHKLHDKFGPKFGNLKNDAQGSF